jgi:hypothetical protein
MSMKNLEIDSMSFKIGEKQFFPSKKTIDAMRVDLQNIFEILA